MSAVSTDRAALGLPQPNRPRATAYHLRQRLLRIALRVLGALLLLAALYVTTLFYLSDEIWLALSALVLTGFGAWSYLSRKADAYRFIFPALASVFVFILLPIGYMVNLGFTNTSGTNLLPFEKARSYLLAETFQKSDGAWTFKLLRDGSAYRLALEGAGGRFATPPLALDGTPATEIVLAPMAEEPAGALPMRDVIALRDRLGALSLKAPDGTRLVMSGLRNFAARGPVYRDNPDGTLTDLRNGELLVPNFKTGFFQRPNGDTVTPGFSVFVGLENFVRIFTLPGLWQPFLAIFAWTIVFAFLSMVFVFSVGLILATILQWDLLKGRAIYRMLVILPYAVPNFISIQIFRGLFNQEFGEINLILQNLFGIKPEWMTDPWLARGMLLMVNTWLGYPYMMILAIGLLQAIPKNLYEAAAVDGSGPFRNFFAITLPMVLPPFVPLLIACFAFNYNNFVLVALLTRGLPDYLGAATPAGTTDLLVTYTYRIAFMNSGQAYGLASAISTLIFIMVAVIALVNLHYARKHKMIA